MPSFFVHLIIIITPYYFLFPSVVHNEEDNDTVITFLCIFQSSHIYVSCKSVDCYVECKWWCNFDYDYAFYIAILSNKTSIPLYVQFS